MKKIYLFVMMGLPGSGKSYFASRLAEKIGAVWLNSDSMRAALFNNPEVHINPVDHKKVFGALQYASRQMLQSGISVVFDANSNKIRNRTGLRTLAEECGARALVIYIRTKHEVSDNRAMNRDVEQHQVKVPAEYLNIQKRILEKPLPEERVIVINGEQDFEQQYTSFREQFKRLSE